MSEFQTLGKFTESQYFRWKNSILEMQLQEQKRDVSKVHLSSMEKDLEIQRLKTILFKTNKVNSEEDSYSLKKQQYQNLRLDLEKELGFSLTEVVIDEISLEIKKL